jgi:ubiquinone/menaquinone biosynthesis C-methylase UbiE
MTTSTQWQLAADAAERYETILVPTILGPFAKALVDSVEIRPGDVVLDVGCGTGAAARFAAVRAGASGRVIGVDINAGMLAVAGRHHAPKGSARLDWREAEASRLPLDDGSADVVLCAHTVQFLSEREGALREMHRVLQTAGRMALSVWNALEANPYFDALVRAVERHIGRDTA